MSRDIDRVFDVSRAIFEGNKNSDKVTREPVLGKIVLEEHIIFVALAWVAARIHIGTLTMDIRMRKYIFGNEDVLGLFHDTFVVERVMPNVHLVNHIVGQHKIVVAVSGEPGVEAALHKHGRGHVVRLERAQEKHRAVIGSESIGTFDFRCLSICDSLFGAVGIVHSDEIVVVHGVDENVARIVVADGVLGGEDKVGADLALSDKEIAGLTDEVDIKGAGLENLAATESQQIIGALFEVGGRTGPLAVKLDFR